MSKETVRISVDLDKKSYEKLKEFCEEYRTPMTRVLRVFVKNLLKMKGEENGPDGKPGEHRRSVASDNELCL